jgi:hypothetical protein
MTNAQKLCDEFKTITQPGSTANTWKWAQRVTLHLKSLGSSTIGSRHNANTVYNIACFECADGSRFAYDLDGARQVWAMPSDNPP